jgi:Fic family protein
MLYLSLYFKTRRREYYDLLQNVRTEGDWEGWMLFFMAGVKETSELAVQTAKTLVDMFEKDRQKIQSIGKGAGSALRMHHTLQQSPIASINKIASMTGLSIPTVTASLKALNEMEITRELTGNRRGRIYCYDRYIKILNEGTEPI